MRAIERVRRWWHMRQMIRSRDRMIHHLRALGCAVDLTIATVEPRWAGLGGRGAGLRQRIRVAGERVG